MTSYSLYLHIPFCRHRCAYCDFNTYAGLQALIPDYVSALCAEARWLAEISGERLPFHTIFFGGGTPSLLPTHELERILTALNQAFELLPGSEISLEANPGTLHLDYLRGLRSLGVNRLSLGVQSALADELRLLEREHDLLDVIRAVEWARRAGFDNLNLDLIYGLPYQTLELWRVSLKWALRLHPEHLSLYALTLEHGTPMQHWVSHGLLPEPDADTAADMYDEASEQLEKAGYTQYEISNWAKEISNFEFPISKLLACRHNLQYWRNLPYLGLGAGAHGYAAGVRYSNHLNPAAYIRRLTAHNTQYEPTFPFPLSPAVAESHPVDRAGEIGETMMMGLRLTREGVRDAVFQARFGVSLQDQFAKPIARLQGDGLLEWAGDALRLTRRGRLLGNRVFREFV